MRTVEWAEAGRLPDRLIRFGIRRLLRHRLRDAARLGNGTAEGLDRFADQLRRQPLAVATREANQQHYEVPAWFFEAVLGPRLKYSCCLFESPQTSLAEAEEAMLELTCRRAGIDDGMRVLDLGCGWGALALWVAERYPRCRVLAVSNSSSQRASIEARSRQRGLTNLEVLTANVVDFEPSGRFDRVVSIEMFEHLRNYEELLRRIAGWLLPEGRLFVHIFCHRAHAYLFETGSRGDWMARHFFTGGMMPSEALLGRFASDLAIEAEWRVDGTHYGRTARAWLDNLDRQRAEVIERFAAEHDPAEAPRIVQRWRMFFMACEELFDYRAARAAPAGQEWLVGHYRLSPVGH